VSEFFVLEHNLNFLFAFLGVWVSELYDLQNRIATNGFHFDFLDRERLKSNALNFVEFRLNLFAKYLKDTWVFSFFERFELKLDLTVRFCLDSLIVLKFEIHVGGEFALDFDGIFEAVRDLESGDCGFVDLCAESFDNLFGWFLGFEC
jgi:hypothetical protein